MGVIFTMNEDRTQAIAACEALMSFMDQEGLRTVWLPFYRTAATVRHAGSRELQSWLRGLIEPGQKQKRERFIHLLGTAIQLDVPGLAGLGENLARQVAMLFEHTDAASGRPHYDWLAEFWALTSMERRSYPKLTSSVDVFLEAIAGQRAAFEATVRRYERRRLELVLGWTRRILLGLLLFTWAIYSTLDYRGSLLSFRLLMAVLGLLGSWEILGLSRHYRPWQQTTLIAIWLSLMAIVIALRGFVPYVLIWAIYLAGGYDAVAMAFGRFFDPNHQKPILPQLSDRKTMAGTIAGFLGSWLCGLSWWSAWLPNWSLTWALLAILLGPMMAFVGDVLPSSAKKQSGLRHSGQSLPRWAQIFGSHGGAVDRGLSHLMVATWLGILTLIRWWCGQ